MRQAKRHGWPQVRVPVDPEMYGRLFADAGEKSDRSGNTATYEAAAIVTEALRAHYERQGRAAS